MILNFKNNICSGYTFLTLYTLKLETFLFKNLNIRLK